MKGATVIKTDLNNLYLYDDLRPEGLSDEVLTKSGALGNQCPTHLSAKKYDYLKSYFYDGSILLAEKVGSQIMKIYINDGQGIIGMVRPIYDGSNNLSHYQRLYYLYDSLGSVSAITGEHGLPLQNYTYSPFGTCLNVTNDPINSLQFIGRYGGYLDNDTGLTYFWHRWYNSKDGRWISRDPIGIRGGVNLYNYVENSPVNYTDRKGFYRRSYEICDKIVKDCMTTCHNSYNECSQNNKCYGNPYKGIMLENCMKVYEKQKSACVGAYIECMDYHDRLYDWIDAQ
jgi:RHS repeat-associated protein